MIPVVAMIMRSRWIFKLSKAQLCHRTKERGKDSRKRTPQKNPQFSRCLILYLTFEVDLLYMNIANRPAPTIAQLPLINIFASITDAAPDCLAALAEAEAVPDGLPVVVVAAADFELALAPEPVGLAEDAVMVTPSAEQIWTEIVSNAIQLYC